MIRNLLLFAAFVFITQGVQANVPESIIKRYRLIVQLIKEDKANELAKLVTYPLRRENPLPAITNVHAFVAYYPTLFDSVFKQKIKSFNDTVIFERNGSYGLVGGDFDGDIWINGDGKIVAVNYSSAIEEKLRQQATKQVQSRVHASINKWDQHVIAGKSEKILVRIDRTDKGLRYVSWSKGNTMAAKPDLVLYHGTEEAQGTMGGWTWTFTNGDWTYIVDNIEMGERPEDCGLFLKLLQKGVLKSTIKLKEIK